MSDEPQISENPEGRAVCVFDAFENASSARRALTDIGFDPDQIAILDGKADAQEIDASAKWFADTDEEIKRYRREIEAGATVVSVPAADQDVLGTVRQVFEENGGRMMTHFGNWVTQTEDLN